MKKINILLIFGAVFLPSRVFAQEILYGFLDLDKLFQSEDLTVLSFNIINLLFLIALGTILVYLFISAFRYITAFGNMEKAMTARNLFLQVIMGMVIVLASYAVLRFILGVVFAPA